MIVVVGLHPIVKREQHHCFFSTLHKLSQLSARAVQSNLAQPLPTVWQQYSFCSSVQPRSQSSKPASQFQGLAVVDVLSQPRPSRWQQYCVLFLLHIECRSAKSRLQSHNVQAFPVVAQQNARRLSDHLCSHWSNSLSQSKWSPLLVVLQPRPACMQQYFCLFWGQPL